MFHALIVQAFDCCVKQFDQAKVAPLLPMQNHLPLMYCKVQACPVVVKVIVEPPQPALVTVMTMLPLAKYMAKVLI